MEKAGLRRAVILLLVLINAAALSVLLYRNVCRMRSAEALAAGAQRYLAALGVTAADGVLDGRTDSREVITLARDAEAETDIARAFTGSDGRAFLGGQVYSYTGPAGNCTFFGGGELAAHVTDCGLRCRSASAAKRELTRFLSAAGLDMSGASGAVTPDGNGWRMELTDALAGLSVGNEKLVVTLDAQGFLTLSGRWRVGAARRTRSTGPVSAAAAVAEFAASRSDRIAFSEIRSVRPTYWLYQEVDGAVTLLPALAVETDAGAVVLDAMTGEALA